jgi:CsoR family transcriptional regulator, copper-sensing transcriptional repressor
MPKNATTPEAVETALCMPLESRKRAIRRLAIAKGHLESIQRMLEVQGALEGAGDVVLRGHLEAHVATAALRGDATEMVDEVMEAIRLR